MKGLSFQNGVEFKVTIEGESWAQGAIIQGKVETKPAAKAQVILAEGTDKKVKLKSPDAFVVLEEVTAQNAPYDWKFQLPVDASITDKSSALYLLYGHGDQGMEKLGQLRLSILPHAHIKDFIDLLTSHFRFAFKSFSSGKGNTVEVKLDPPGKDWAMLEQLVLFAKISSDDSMDVRFQFHRKEVDATKGGLATKAVKREITRSWNVNQIIHDFNHRLNKEIITAEMDKVVAEYRDAGWLSS